MKFDNTTAEYIRHCIASRETFALAALPTSDEITIFQANDIGVSKFENLRGFNIGFFDPGSRVEESKISPVRESTPYTKYCEGANYIITRLKQTGGKTVLSRVVAVTSQVDLICVIERYFTLFPHTMRFAYYTEQTGLWFGASPELLFDYDKAEGMLYTMSLAGTRKVTTETQGQPWDEKNQAEHQFVTDYIMQGLRRAGLSPEIYDSAPLRFGAIEHLCDRIRAKATVDPSPVMFDLSPTPALCGWPREEALRQIRAVERHQRHCYGGWIAISTPTRVTAYVNLRSAFVEPTADGVLYNLYVGGGLTADSFIEDEWQETQAKASALLGLL